MTPLHLFYFLVAIAGGGGVIGFVCILLGLTYFALVGASQKAAREAREGQLNEPRH